jgi:hypothetical protein
MLFRMILIVSAIYGLFYAFTTIFSCGDPRKIADAFLGSKKCLPSTFILTTGYIYGILNVIADWTFVLIPISVLIESDLDRRSKISVSLVMALGAVGSVSSILRMVYLKGLLLGSHGLDSMHPLFYQGSHIETDISIASTIKATIWATAEPGTGIIAASIAILRPLIRNITTSVRTHTSRSASHKASLASEEDNIALTSLSAKHMSMYSVRSDEPWSPTIEVGKAEAQRMINVQMVNGRGSPTPKIRMV